MTYYVCPFVFRLGFLSNFWCWFLQLSVNPRINCWHIHVDYYTLLRLTIKSLSSHCVSTQIYQWYAYIIATNIWEKDFFICFANKLFYIFAQEKIKYKKYYYNKDNFAHKLCCMHCLNYRNARRFIYIVRVTLLKVEHISFYIKY